MVQTAIVGDKRKAGSNANDGKAKRRILLPGKEDLSASGLRPYSSLLGISGLSAAPSLDLYSNISATIGPSPRPGPSVVVDGEDLPKKKKYKKEAWPGHNKPVHSVL